MNEQQQSLDTLRDIRTIMERSSRFLSLSGLSGISAGLSAILGAWVAFPYVYGRKSSWIGEVKPTDSVFDLLMNNWLFWIAVLTFTVALVTALFFTRLRTRKDNIPVWGQSSRRLVLNIALPLVVAGVFMYKLIEIGELDLLAPTCLIFYGLALVNASKYTHGELRWLGCLELLLGIINLWTPGYSLVCWVVGFGFLHILYGGYMWWKYERSTVLDTSRITL